MPITWTLEPAGRYMQFAITDPYTIEEWRTAAAALVSSSFCRQYGKVLVDRRSASAPTTAFVETMTHFMATHRSELSGKRAAVLVADDAGFGMSRMTELVAELEVPEVFIRTFRDYETAVQWLIGARDSQ